MLKKLVDYGFYFLNQKKTYVKKIEANCQVQKARAGFALIFKKVSRH